MLVLAIAILIFENVGGGMRLVATESEGETDVADIFGNVIVEGGDFLEFGGAALNQLLRLGANFGGGVAAAFFEVGVPCGDFVPELKVVNCTSGRTSAGGCEAFFGFLGMRSGPRDVAVLPVVDCRDRSAYVGYVLQLAPRRPANQ